MTTIATNGEMVVADRQTSDLNFGYKSQAKIERVGEFIIGACGSVGDCLLYSQWFKEGQPKSAKLPKTTKGFCGLAVHESGRIFEFVALGLCQEVNEPFYAIGSGTHFAIGAMAAGASPKKAVQIASKYERFTGFGLTILKHE